MTDVQICNLALAYLGDAATVTSVATEDGSVQSHLCAMFYPLAVDVLLEMYDWVFITTRARLVPVQESYDDWAFAYGMPSNANQIISVIPSCDYDGFYDPAYGNYAGWWQWGSMIRPFERDNTSDFQVETNPDGVLVILSNIEDPICRFTSNQFTESSFPALFTDALAWRLAAMLAGPLIKGDVGAAESKRCMTMFGAMVTQAMIQDAPQRSGDTDVYPVWIRDR